MKRIDPRKKISPANVPRRRSARAPKNRPPALAELLRPDDLLNLRVEFVNLSLDTPEDDEPALFVTDANEPAFLTFVFPPQTIAERAYFEARILPPGGAGIQPEQGGLRPDADAGKTAVDPPLDPPGYVDGARRTVAQVADPTRLVFSVPPNTRIPFSIAGLLNWSKLELNVSVIAAIGPRPTADQIARAPAIAKPAANETAIVLPYRMVISPTRDVAWDHRTAPFTSFGRTEMWHTRLQNKTAAGAAELSALEPASLRAIWSPDYNANHRGAATRLDPDLQRTAIAPDDRYQIVILTSAFHGYQVDVEVEMPLPIFGMQFTQRMVKFTRTVPFVPQPFKVEQLMLSPLGGWLRSRGNWNPPRLVPPSQFKGRANFKDIFANLPRARGPRADLVEKIAPDIAENLVVFPPELFVPPENPQLDLSEWVHLASQGRDHYVRIVYEGELWPFRHRAALIKVTERKFKEQGAIVGAYQMQRLFVVVREPVKEFAERGNPFQRVRLTTLVTPDIANPDIPNDPADPSGPNHVVGANRSFWVKVMTSATTRELFQFHAVGTDMGDHDVDFTIPLMFVSISDLPDVAPNATQAVAATYNSAKELSTAHIPGQKVMFAKADDDPAKRNDNTQLVTQTITFVVDAAAHPPRMFKAQVKIPQVEELLGTTAPTTIRFFPDYVAKGFDAATGVFAEIVNDDGTAAAALDVKFSSDQAGGFATPNLGVTTLTRALGPLGGKATDALSNQFDPAEFFKGVTAQLFGSFDLIKLLPVATLDKNAPKLRTQTEDMAGGKRIVATLEWEPEFLEPDKKLDLGVAMIEKDHGKTSKLLIHGRIEKPLKFDGTPAGEPTFDFSGTLNDFRVSVLKSVSINFTAFNFEAKKNEKTDVQVHLAPDKPIEFAGDLTFVEELRKAIPPGLFGDGPSLDISASGIRAGFAFALAPIAVGVFSLKDVSLGAALTLPFLDGKPSFDFNVSERAHPFLLAVSLFGGGGFFHLQLDTAGIKELEAAFEFGATAAIDIGVASGEVHIMAGIYFSMQRKDPGADLACTLAGYLRMGGSLSVLGLVHVSVEFNLSFTYDSDKDKAYGRATLTVQISVLGLSKSVDLTVERAFGGQSGDPTFAQLVNTAEVWSDYALAFA